MEGRGGEGVPERELVLCSPLSESSSSRASKSSSRLASLRRGGEGEGERERGRYNILSYVASA